MKTDTFTVQVLNAPDRTEACRRLAQAIADYNAKNGPAHTGTIACRGCS